MKKFRFIQPYSPVINIRGTEGLSDKAKAGGATNTSTLFFKTGDLVDGEKVQMYVNEIDGRKPAGFIISIKNPSPNALEPTIPIPLQFLTEANVSSTNVELGKTPMKKGIALVLGIGAILVILKLTKAI